MKLIDLSKTPEKNALHVAAEVMRMGGIVAYPTETFYALGAKFDDTEAIERICELKGRSADKAISIIASDDRMVMTLASDISEEAQALMDSHWPGPLTMVLPAQEGLPQRVTQCGTIAVRVPGDSFALRLVSMTGFAITATSANPAKMPPADTAQGVIDYFGDEISLVIDGGTTPGGLPSTIVDLTRDKARVLRAGAVNIR